MIEVIDLNPQVKKLLEDAVAAAKPIWLGFMSGSREVHSRLALFMVSEGPDYYVNVNSVQTDPVPAPIRVDRCCLAKDKVGPCFANGPLDHARDLKTGDSLLVVEGRVRFTGKLPQ